jgi:hypothetical protein
VVDDLLFDLPEPTTRVCRFCRVERPMDMFYLDSEARQSAKARRPVKQPCRACQWERNNARLGPRRAILDRIKIEAGGCADCGLFQPDHPEIYDFDHRPGVMKEGKLSDLATKGTVEAMIAETEKCDVVCANCHRIRTRTRDQTRYDQNKAKKVVR